MVLKRQYRQWNKNHRALKRSSTVVFLYANMTCFKTESDLFYILHALYANETKQQCSLNRSLNRKGLKVRTNVTRILMVISFFFNKAVRSVFLLMLSHIFLFSYTLLNSSNKLIRMRTNALIPHPT
jgi:hypothetical protein